MHIAEYPLYRDFTTQEAIDAAYNPSHGRSDSAAILQAFTNRSAQARAQLECRPDLKFGPTVDETLDFFPAEGQHSDSRPLHVFIHGGYWRSLSSKDFSYMAQGLAQAGVNVAVINYALCPKVTLGEIVRQCRAALAWLYQSAPELGFDRRNITVSGHSAGGHLLGMLLATDWAADYALPADLIRGGIAISGLFDLGPFPWSWLQPKLQLTGRDVRELSPLFQPVQVNCPVLAAVGEQESDEFHRQSQAWVEHLVAAFPEQSIEYLSVPARDHFSIIDDLAAGEGPLMAAVRRQIGG
ncbi:alpha/beta hydrolase [Natronospirillum operosum]|uniref:Alpha/beta hydrolase n=1 Tax=Natronospirillum operosum TaxID=2759953 RepID=A0A4Z0W7J7_9GAMM|nr:alpha/beta hydrolase [Natronospirillum operosum]TGG93357.1 alpha/beta hydrolase [Natronospirillum operosum]